MLVTIRQYKISLGYELVLSDGKKLHIHKPSPTEEQINNLLIEYERFLLNNIDLKGEERDVYSDESGDRRTDSGEDLALGLPPS